MKNDNNGCSQVRSGKEQYEFFDTRIGRKETTRCQYDYRDTDGTLFSCISSSLENARKRRDKWLAKRKKYSVSEAEKYLGRSPGSLSYHIKKGHIEGQRESYGKKAWYFYQYQLDAFALKFPYTPGKMGPPSKLPPGPKLLKEREAGATVGELALKYKVGKNRVWGVLKGERDNE